MMGYMRISKRGWYRAGGFAESRCVRVTRGKSWAYFYRVD
jgi:predicted enzyme related to lactoylglutathione lyase